MKIVLPKEKCKCGWNYSEMEEKAKWIKSSVLAKEWVGLIIERYQARCEDGEQ